MWSCDPAHVRQPSGLAPWPPGEVGSTCDLQSLEWTWQHLWKGDKGLILSPGHRGEMRGEDNSEGGRGGRSVEGGREGRKGREV